jgi:phage-related protein
MGNVRKSIPNFRNSVKKPIGDELQLMQVGRMPKDAKPFKEVGSGIFEIALMYDKDAYRCVVAIQLGDKIYSSSCL